jgi:predicted amidophosphoribosyltransferase
MDKKSGSSSKSGQQAVDPPPLIDNAAAMGLCAFCRKEGKKICGPCGRENSRPTFYCSIACQFTDFPVHKHACSLEYPRKADPMNGIV